MQHSKTDRHGLQCAGGQKTYMYEQKTYMGNHVALGFTVEVSPRYQPLVVMARGCSLFFLF